MSIFDKISSLITGLKPEKRETEKVSSSADETPIVVVENPIQIKGLTKEGDCCGSCHQRDDKATDQKKDTGNCCPLSHES